MPTSPRRCFPWGFAGLDRQGFPVLVERIGSIDLVGMQAAMGTDEFIRWVRTATARDAGAGGWRKLAPHPVPASRNPPWQPHPRLPAALLQAAHIPPTRVRPCLFRFLIAVVSNRHPSKTFNRAHTYPQVCWYHEVQERMMARVCDALGRNRHKMTCIVRAACLGGRPGRILVGRCERTLHAPARVALSLSPPSRHHSRPHPTPAD